MSEFYLNLFSCAGKVDVSKTLSDYFHIPADKIFEFLGSHYQENSAVREFIEYFQIDLNCSYYDDIFIACRHATTSFDNLQYVKKFGMLSLCELLSTKSPLSEFLRENLIRIDVESKMLYYNDEPHDILGLQEQCIKCEKGRSICRDKYPVFSCDYRNKLHTLYCKLYDHRGETEVFLNGSIQDIYDYRYVRCSPEILYTLDTIISFYGAKKLLRHCWQNKDNNKYYILEFDVRIDDLVFIDRNIDHGNCYDDEFFSAFSCSCNDYKNYHVKKAFQYNLFVVERLIQNFNYGTNEIYAPFKKDTRIDPWKIRIIREHDVNERTEYDR